MTGLAERVRALLHEVAGWVIGLSGMGLGWAIALFVGLFAGSIALGCLVIVLWDADHFRVQRLPFWHGRHPAVRAAGLVAKNAGGALLFLTGIVLLLPGVPGQGFLTLLIGLTLMDFPGKRRLERSLIRRPAVLRAFNRIRARFGKPPLLLD